MNFSHLSFAAKTDIGRRRDENEDTLLQIPELGVFGIADGMGGALGGKLASQAAVKAIEIEMPKLKTEENGDDVATKAHAVGTALDAASMWIKRKAESMGIYGSGTTIVILVFDVQKPKAISLHAGDSRLYCLRGNRLRQITKDHSIATMAGLESEKHLPPFFRGVVTRAVGVRNSVNLEEMRLDVEEGDIFLICSDGLTRMISDNALTKILKDNSEKSLEHIAEHMINAANIAGGMDNISVLLIKVGKAS